MTPSRSLLALVLLAVTVALGVGLGAVISAVTARAYARMSVSGKLSWDPAGVSQAGVTLTGSTIGRDDFTRTTSNGWGTANVGGTWLPYTAPDSAFATDGSQALRRNRNGRNPITQSPAFICTTMMSSISPRHSSHRIAVSWKSPM